MHNFLISFYFSCFFFILILIFMFSYKDHGMIIQVQKRKFVSSSLFRVFFLLILKNNVGLYLIRNTMSKIISVPHATLPYVHLWLACSKHYDAYTKKGCQNISTYSLRSPEKINLFTISTVCFSLPGILELILPGQSFS